MGADILDISINTFYYSQCAKGSYTLKKIKWNKKRENPDMKIFFYVTLEQDDQFYVHLDFWYHFAWIFCCLHKMNLVVDRCVWGGERGYVLKEEEEEEKRQQQ